MKKFAVIFLALVLALTLIACGKSNDTTSTEGGSTVETSSEQTTSVEDTTVSGDNDASMPESWFAAG